MRPQRVISAKQLLSWIGIGLLGIISVSGCSGNAEAVKEQGAVGENLTTVANAYRAATDKNNRPPTSPEELKPFLPPGVDQATLFQSVRDGQPFVILWGTDPRQGMDVKPLVYGYEKEGQGGERFVMTAMGVMQMTDEDFAQANFPAGHQP